MLVKEYRILLPLTVDEYRIAQLYMIQKKSRLDSSGAGSGVEILTNRPYTDGPGGSGQYTYKIYHVGSKIPVWIRSVLPSTALEAHEEAWNAYPVTKTRYSCPLMDRMSIEVETKYLNDAGTQENIFDLSKDELKDRVVDYMDFVREPVSNHDYCPEEDPKMYRSDKTGRGPLSDDWVAEHVRLGRPVMCAYKLCRVEFRYWGLQTRAERWIHDLALRGTMLRAHRQAWAWQDEWVGLRIEDIRRLEEDAAAYLSKVMAGTKKTDTSADADSDASSDIFFDCNDQAPFLEKAKPSLIRWSSELLLDGADSPPLTPKHDSSTQVLILIFHGDLCPESPDDTKTTDADSLRTTVETLVMSHYPHLKGRVHVHRVVCGSELSGTVSSLKSLSPSFGSFHPSLALLLASSPPFHDAVQGTIRQANKIYERFINSKEGQLFNGEIFAVGDCLGGLLLYEALTRSRGSHSPLSRNSSSVSTQSRFLIPENKENDPSAWSLNDFPTTPTDIAHNENGPRSAPLGRPNQRNLSAPPAGRVDKLSASTDDTTFRKDRNEPMEALNFRPTTAFLLGCPLAIVLMQRKLSGEDVSRLACNQLYNLYYPLDTCGARLEPVLNNQLAVLPSVNVPRYQRFPLGDGRHILFDNDLETSTLWGNHRIDHQLYCPPEMVSLPSQALPNILHASYWESKDVGSFILRQFVNSDETHVVPVSNFGSNKMLNIDLPPTQWNRRRSKYKTVNLSPNHRANDIIAVEGSDQVIHARFCYGPMDLVALSREAVLIYVCPSGGEWFLHSQQVTDSHGRVTANLGKLLAIGIHSVKMIVAGDHSYLDIYVAVVPSETRCVVFSIDGSLTGSVSVTGKDPRVRPGAIDVTRFWQQQGYLIIYVTARPDMQQRVVGSWLAQNNFPHGLLFFTPSFSTDPLKQKTQHLKNLQQLGIIIQAAYGSSKDVQVYTSAGIDPDRIFKVGGTKRRGCVALEDGYAQHLHDLHSGRLHFTEIFQSGIAINENFFATSNSHQQRQRHVQRTQSFTPRSGKYESFHNKKYSQISVSTR